MPVPDRYFSHVLTGMVSDIPEGINVPYAPEEADLLPKELAIKLAEDFFRTTLPPEDSKEEE